ncbi:hypothetical protein Acor_43220 [Acrocarpospora corrugata]|uniref:HTH tetR-type domain-containing protein n=1 Tax=Acrocarpospora corrugata TaxID=35763 RepID=A0A5M3VZF9_9ACTN|nr:TetR/AcrR family transcriptional regulator [Acrocarpospora corrugata]GES02257.1 hypothetical protein Acor_43220 [Acrocarpospora corrugata]
MNTRKYEQKLRAEAAEETRQRILLVMYERLRTTPAKTISLDQVAKEARVARSTIYTIFGSRAGLFDALFRYLLDRAGFDRVVTAVTHPDAREHLRGSFRAGVATYAAERDVTRAVYATAHLNPDALANAVHRDEQGRAEGMRHLAQRLHDQRVLRPDTTVAEATDLLYALTAFDTFDLLHTGRGLPPDQVADRLITLAERTLYR